ncbi:hypothetical protein Tco_1329127 [Tanacetum coccineum]
MSNNSETDSEISLSIFDVRSSDEENTPVNDRFSKADGFHVVPSSIIGNFLTPRADISFASLDEYAITKKIIKSKTTDLNTKTSETVGKTNEKNTQKPKTVYESVNIDKVIIEDWNSDDEDDVSEVQTVSPDNPEILLQDHAVVDSVAQVHMYWQQSLSFRLMGRITMEALWLLEVIPKETECLILSPSFKLLDESQVVLRVRRKDDVYSLDLKNIVPSGGITCLYANATVDESKLWHRRLDVAYKEGQHQMAEDEQVLHDELEKMVDQEVVAKALDDTTR